MIHIAPGDIADTIAGDMGGATEEVLAKIRSDYGLDKPFFVQLGLYISNVVQLDFGYSFFFNTPVTSLIAERLPATLLLVFTAQLLALVVGVILGVISAKKPNGLFSHFVTLLALFGYSAPVFWTGIMLLIGLSLLMPIFPVAGYDGRPTDRSIHLETVARYSAPPFFTRSDISVYFSSAL